MKRKSILIAYLSLLFLFPVLAQAAPVGKFTSIEGDVDVTAPGKQAVPANLGDPLNVGDIIRTKSKSKCEVTFLDGSVLRLAETSRLRVAEFSQEKEQRSATLNLFRGKIQNIVKTVTGAAGERSKYEVQMPTAVTGVRGTNFFAFFQAGVSGAVFKEGTGYGYSLNRPQEVRTIAVGQAMLVTSPDLPPAVRTASSLELNQHEKDTAPSTKGKDDSGLGGGTGTMAAQIDVLRKDVGQRAQTLLMEYLPNFNLLTKLNLELVPASFKTEVSVFSGKVTSDFLSSASLYGDIGKDADASSGAIGLESFTGPLRFSGTATHSGMPAGAWGGSVQGKAGSDIAFWGYLNGVSGSWEGQMSSIYVTGKGAGYLSGILSGTYNQSNRNMSGNGTAMSTAILGNTTLSPDLFGPGTVEILGTAGAGGETGFPLPRLGSLSVADYVIPSTVGRGKLTGINTVNPLTGKEQNWDL